MKIQAVNNYNYDRNTNFKGANKFCKYSIHTLIAGASLFILSNAIDTFKSGETAKQVTEKFDIAASLLSIAGTALGLFGIEKLEYKNKDSK